MIASVIGEVKSGEHGALVLEVGGVGLRVAVPDSVIEGETMVGMALSLPVIWRMPDGLSRSRFWVNGMR